MRADVFHSTADCVGGLTVTDPIFSAYFLMLNRNVDTHSALPFKGPIDLSHSDSLFQAHNRAKLCEEQSVLNRESAN